MSDINDDLRQQIIENDLGWAQQLSVTQVGDQLMLGGDVNELPFNISKVMEEKEFVRKWLPAFAVGNKVGVNYFNQEEWFSFTMCGARAVMVVNKDEETGQYAPVMVIPPLLSINFTADDRRKLRQASGMMYANGHDANKKNDLTSNLRVASALNNPDFGLEAKPLSMSDLIAPEFFAKYDIVPEVEQVVYWLRDVKRKGLKTTSEDLEKVRRILFNDHHKRPVTKEEYLFVYEFSLHSYEVQEKLDAIGEKLPEESVGEDGEQKLAGPSNQTASPFDC